MQVVHCVGRVGLAVIAALSLACSKGMTVEHDPELGVSVTRMSGNVVGIDQCMSNQLIVNAAKVDDPEDPRLVLWVQLRGFTAVRPDVMTIHVDDEAWTFDDETLIDAQMACPERTRAEKSLGITETRSCVYLEIYWYTVSPEHLARLAAASDATIRLEGINGHVERKFSVENLARIQEFLAREVPAATAPSG